MNGEVLAALARVVAPIVEGMAALGRWMREQVEHLAEAARTVRLVFDAAGLLREAARGKEDHSTGFMHDDKGYDLHRT